MAFNLDSFPEDNTEQYCSGCDAMFYNGGKPLPKYVFYAEMNLKGETPEFPFVRLCTSCIAAITARPVGFCVMHERCEECLFGQNALVHNERRKEIIKQCLKEESHFICHLSTLADNGTVCCRAFYDKFPNATQAMQVAARIGLLHFTDERGNVIHTPEATLPSFRRRDSDTAAQSG